MYQVVKPDNRGKRRAREISARRATAMLEGQAKDAAATLEDLKQSPGRTIATPHGEVRWMEKPNPRGRERTGRERYTAWILPDAYAWLCEQTNATSVGEAIEALYNKSKEKQE